MKTFTVTNHIKLLRRMYVDWQDCETGAPEINPKRPYGNSNVAGDVAVIIGLRKDYKDLQDNHLSGKEEDACDKLHQETRTALQIVLATGKFKAGTYRKTEEYNDRAWELVK